MNKLKRYIILIIKFMGMKIEKKLSNILTKNISVKLNKVFLVGSGSEVCEADEIKLSMSL